MAFTNNRVQFFNGKSFNENQFATGLGMGMSSFVTSGLELTGVTLTSGTFNSAGAFGQLGNAVETQDITASYTGFIIIKTTFNGSSSVSEIIEDVAFNTTDPRDTSNIKYFTIYELDAGVIVNDFRHIEYIKSLYWELAPEVGPGFVRQVINGFRGEAFSFPGLSGAVEQVNGENPDVSGNVELIDVFRVNIDQTDLTPATVATYQEVIDFVKLKAGIASGGSLDTGGGFVGNFHLSIQNKNLMVFILGTSAEMQLDGHTLSKEKVANLLSNEIKLSDFTEEIIFTGESYGEGSTIIELTGLDLYDLNYRNFEITTDYSGPFNGSIGPSNVLSSTIFAHGDIDEQEIMGIKVVVDAVTNVKIVTTTPSGSLFNSTKVITSLKVW